MGSWQFTPYSVIYLSAAFLSLIIAVIAWKMRPVRATGLFSLLSFSIGIWVTGYFLGFFNKDIGIKFIMLRIEYLGILSSGYLWLLFASTYTHYDKWLKTWVKIALAIIPVLSFIQILTIEYHSFFYKTYFVTQVNNLFVIEKVYALGFYIAVSYNYLVILTGTIFLMCRIIRMPTRFRRQNFNLVLVVVVIIVPNFSYISGNNLFKPYDPTPLSFALAGILFLFSVYFYRFLDVVPVAYNLVFKTMKPGVIIIDKRKHLLEINTAAEQIFNYTSKQALGKPIVKIFPDFKGLIKNRLEENEVKTEIKIGKNENIYELRINVLEDYSSNIIGHIIMLYDISEQKRAYEELDAFARTVAHDLKNPLSSVIGFSSLLSKKNLDQEKHNAYVKKINISANKMNNIIEALLLLAKIRNEENIFKSKLNTEKIIDSAISRLSETITKNKAKIIKPDNKWPEVTGDPVLIEEVWVNYISNAVKYGGNPPVVKLSFKHTGNIVQMSVKDNGTGISEEEQCFLFTEFSRLQRHKNEVPGHGLGLSIVQRIITKHGGKVGIESKPGIGSMFFFTLPVADKGITTNLKKH